MKSLRRNLLERLTARRPADAMLLGAQALGVQAIRSPLAPSSPLYRSPGGEAIELPVDAVISPYVYRHGAWQETEVAFLREHAAAGDCVLVDVGANVGLITRQVLHSTAQVRAAVCFEPHPLNHLLLQRNLAHLPQACCVQAALGSEAGELAFYEELNNAGNYSLNADAVRGLPHRVSSVPCLLASEDAVLGPLPATQRGLPLLYKSDIQGFDEIVATALPASFWARVQAGVMELTRIERAAYPRERLGALLEGFTLRRFASTPERNLSVAEILAFTEGRDMHHEDLYFART